MTPRRVSSGHAASPTTRARSRCNAARSSTRSRRSTTAARCSLRRCPRRRSPTTFQPDLLGGVEVLQRRRADLRSLLRLGQSGPRRDGGVDQMKAIVVQPQVKDSIHMRDMPDPKMKPGPGRRQDDPRRPLRHRRRDRARPLRQAAATANEFLILGHENFGVVEAVGRRSRAGRRATSSSPPSGARAASARSARPARTTCAAAASTPSAASCGATATWREYYAESPRFLNRSRSRSATSPCCSSRCRSSRRASITPILLQRRMKALEAALGMVLGAGPIGLLAAAVLRVRGLRTIVIGREDPQRPARADRTAARRRVRLRRQQDARPTSRRKSASPTSSSKRRAGRRSSSTRWRSSTATACCACCR